MLKKAFTQWLGGNQKTPAEKKSSFPWIDLNDINQLHLEANGSEGQIQFVFKHSTRCGISSMMLRRFEGEWKNHNSGIQFFLLDLIRYRELSNALADSFEVQHQSPQVLLLKGGNLIAHKSHGDISSLNPDFLVQ